jgi:hypothetical protein
LQRTQRTSVARRERFASAPECRSIIARAVLFLVSGDSDFTVGELLFADGGAMVTMAGA